MGGDVKNVGPARTAERARRRKREIRPAASWLSSTALAAAVGYQVGNQGRNSAFVLSMAVGLMAGVHTMVALECREDRRAGRG